MNIRRDLPFILGGVVAILAIIIAGVLSLRQLDGHLSTLRPSPMQWSQREYQAIPPAACPGATVRWETALTITASSGGWYLLGRHYGWADANGLPAIDRAGQTHNTTIERFAYGLATRTVTEAHSVVVPDFPPGVYYRTESGVTDFSDAAGNMVRIEVRDCEAG